eukprot:Opistho-2@1077
MPAAEKLRPDEAAKTVAAFRAKVEEWLPANKDKCYDADVDDIRRLDTLCLRYLTMRDFNVTAAFELARDNLLWRRSFGIREITEASLPREMFESGVFFMRGVDSKGCKVGIVRIRLHKKDGARGEEMKRFVAYHLNYHFSTAMATETEQITVLFDLSQAGLGNMDMDLMKFFIDGFKFHFPNFLNLLIVYEMPWLMNAAWKVIKSWLNERAIAKVKFATKQDLAQYIPKEQLMTYYGGTDGAEFVYEAYPSPTPPAKESKLVVSSILGVTAETASAMVPENEKEKQRTDRASKPDAFMTPTTRHKHRHGAATPIASSPLARSASMETTSSGFLLVPSFSAHGGRHAKDKGLLLVSPNADRIEFVGPFVEGAEVSTKLHMANQHARPVAFKVKTTSPDKFCVRPNSGVVAPGQSAEVAIHVMSTSRVTVGVSADKFLLQTVLLPEGFSGDMAQLLEGRVRTQLAAHS